MIYVTSIEAEPPNPGLEFVEFSPTLISPDGNAQQIAKLKFLRKNFKKFLVKLLALVAPVVLTIVYCISTIHFLKLKISKT